MIVQNSATVITCGISIRSYPSSHRSSDDSATPWISAVAPMIPASCPSTGLQDQKGPVPLDNVLRLAGQLLDSGQMEQAEHLLDYILSAAPDAALALNLKAVLLYLTNRSELAIGLMERAVGLA